MLQGLLDGQAAQFQGMVDAIDKQNDLVGQIIGRVGATTPPGDQAAAVGGIGDLIHTLFVNNQLTSTLLMNGAALDGLIDGTKGPDQKLTPALVGGFSAPASRMLSGLLGGGQLGGLLQEAASLQFPMSGTQTMVDDLNPSNIGSGAQLQRLQAAMSQIDAFYGQMSGIMKTVSTLSTQAAINPLNPRPLGKPQAKKPKKLDVALGSTEALLAPGQTANLSLALYQRARKVLKTARKKHVKRLTARVHVRVLDASGARVEQTFKVKVGNGRPAKGG